MSTDSDSSFAPENIRRLVIAAAVVIVVVSIAALGVNAVWGPKFKRDAFCAKFVVGEEIDFKQLSANARAADRIPVINIESSDGTSKKLEPPGPNDPEPPGNLGGSLVVNFGTPDDRVLCQVHFKDGHVANVRKGDD